MSEGYRTPCERCVEKSVEIERLRAEAEKARSKPAYRWRFLNYSDPDYGLGQFFSSALLFAGVVVTSCVFILKGPVPEVTRSYGVLFGTLPMWVWVHLVRRRFL